MTVHPFPLARRRDLVLRQAAWFLEQGPRGAEANLRRQLQVQRDTLLRRSVAPTTADAALRALEAAIRCEAQLLMRERGA